MNLDWLIRGRRVEEERNVGETPPSVPARVATAPAGVAASPLRVGPNVAQGWTPLGPSGVLFGQAGARSEVSGRCRAIAASPDGNRAYAGTANGGVWYTDDAGKTWLPLDAFATTRDISGRIRHTTALSVGALNVQWGANVDGSQDQVLVATGESSLVETEIAESQSSGIGIRTATGPAATVRAGDLFTDPWTLEATNLAGTGVYALARDHTGVVWAATRRGLYSRPATNQQTWTEVKPGGSREWFSDVAAGAGDRLYAVTQRGTLYVRIAAGAWTRVNLPDTFPTFTIGTTTPARATIQRLRLATSPASAVAAVLTRPDRLWRIAGTPPTAQPVRGLPPLLFGNPARNDQSWYDMMIAAATDDADLLIIGGSYVNQDSPLFPASLYRGKMQQVGGNWVIRDGTSPGPVMVGKGVHADVHAAAWVGAGASRRVWVGCDGGVYRSNAGANPGTFVNCNRGLATLEPNYLAQHPAMEGELIIGTQDNGILVADAPETWHLEAYGDGGGVVFDPADSRRRIGQWTTATWKMSAGTAAWSARRWFSAPSGSSVAVQTAYQNAENAEQSGSSFYSAASAVLGPSGLTQLAIGTIRIWFAADWKGRTDTTWRTLPGLLDPNQLDTAGTGPRAAADRFAGNEQAIVCRWANANDLYVVTTKRVLLIRRSGTTWAQTVLYDKDRTAARKAKNRTDQIPPGMPLTEVFPHDPTRGTSGSVYVLTANPNPDDDAHHVWWYDGTSKWIDAGLDVDAPAHSIAIDPANTQHVFVGTAVGVFRGTWTAPASAGANPTWTWERFSDGLPEAMVSDLHVHGATRTLRATLSGRGVFEVALDVAAAPPADRCYLRAFQGDLRLRTFAANGTRPVPKSGSTRPYAAADYEPLQWDASPDIRIRRAPGSPPFVLSARRRFFANDDRRSAEAMWVQAALRAAGDADVPVDGREDSNNLFDQALRRRTTHSHITRSEWTSLLRDAGTTCVLPFRDDATGAVPSDAEANGVVLDEPDATGTAACRANGWNLRIDVVVHARAWRPVDPTKLRVVLLRAAWAGRSSATPAPQLPSGWAASLAADVANAPASRGAWLGTSGWHWVGADHVMQQPSAGPHGRQGAVVSLQTTLPIGDHLLMAVVLNTGDALTTTERDPREVARKHHQVALRSVHVVAEPDVSEHAFHEWHAHQAPVVGTTGPTDDDRRLVENRAPKLVAKPRLCLDFHERTVTGFKLALPSGSGHWQASWSIVDSTDRAVREHPSFKRTDFTSNAAGSRVTAGHHTWAWDGRGTDDNGAFVSAGTYRSQLVLKQEGSATTYVYETAIEVFGHPYQVHVFGRPKADADLRAAITAIGDPVDSSGNRIARDSWITVHRGGTTAGHCVFLGQGCIEASRAETGTSAGSLPVPSDTTFKGWIRIDPHGTASTPDRVQLEDLGASNGRIALSGGTGPAVVNPYSTPAGSAWMDGVQFQGVAVTRTSNGLSYGNCTVTTVTGSCPSPSGIWNGIHAHDASFGTLNLTATGGGTIPRFDNKQTKRSQASDALLADDTRSPNLSPAPTTTCTNPDEPLHLQATFQAGLMAGFRHRELPFTSAVADAPGHMLAIRVRMEPYPAGSLYALYHHAVVMGHDYDDDGTRVRITAFVPRTVLRVWNQQRRNLLTDTGRLTVSWFVTRTATGTTTTVHRLVSTADDTFVSHAVGKALRDWTPGASLASGEYHSVFRYRLRLEPGDAAANAWVSDTARADGLSASGAALEAETIVTAGAHRYLQGQSRLRVRQVP